MSLGGAFLSVARISTVSQILLFLPLTLSTLSTTAFLSLSLLLFIHSIIHGSLLLVFGPGILSLLQVPMHPFLLLLCFNIFSNKTSLSLVVNLANYWGALLRISTPFFIVIEAVASLLVAQTLGQTGKKLAARSESWQFSLLIGSAIAYVVGAWWIIMSYPAAAVSPVAASLLGSSLTTFVFLTLIGFNLRRSNVIESSSLLLYFALNIWLSGFDQASYSEPLTSTSYPVTSLLDNILPHLQSLVFFVTNTLPKPIIISLTYRLSVLHLSSQILPTIGADSWDVPDVEERPTSKLTHILLTYRQAIFVTTYTHLLLIDPSSQIWWRHVTVLICLGVWSVELLIAGVDDDDDIAPANKWKIE